MKHKIITLSLFLSLAILGYAQNPKSIPQTFTSGNKEFLLNGKPYVIRAGELHFPRIPREYWDQRIKLCKAMGMNTICIYLFWNYHEQEQDVFDFSGQKDVAAFVKLVQANGMYCIVRPGPYACAEWDMGGLPWWLLKKKDIQVRTTKDAFFMQRTAKYLKEVGKQLAPLQLQNGGNIIMVQVENEYASFGAEQDYMVAIRDELRNSGFDKVQLFRCDWSSNFNKYELDGVATTLNFGAGSDIEKQFKTFQEKYPTAPLMCSEYWSGWFDHWGKPHETRSVDSFIGSLKDMMDKRISFSLYMAHGGTTFGQWGGANAPPYSAMATSYDYNAPIGEQGNTTEKFFAVRNLLKNYLQEGEVLGEIPSALPIIEIPAFDLKETAGVFENLPKGKKSKDILPMETFNQGWGRILYRCILPKSDRKQKLIITELHDWANVFINGKSIGKLDRRRGDHTIEIPVLEKQSQLDILVEATGRVNYGKAIIDRKGITEKVKLMNGTNVSELKKWTIYNFPVDYKFQNNAKFVSKPTQGPSWYKGTFNLSEIGDTFLDMSNWGKGMIWVNGYNIGRFWKIGPQQTLFMPGCWLKKGKNEVIVLDVDGPKENSIKGLKQAVLDQLQQDESLLHRTKNQNLDLTSEKNIASGSFLPGNGWQEVKFNQAYSGRYFCLEALNAQQEGDFLSAIAELELMDKKGNTLSTLNWKIIYADSEEITAANQAADKIFDQQESTIWQTQMVGAKPKYPHQIVIDLGAEVQLNGFRYLPRSDKNTKGMIKDYQIFFKSNPFKY